MRNGLNITLKVIGGLTVAFILLSIVVAIVDKHNETAVQTYFGTDKSDKLPAIYRDAFMGGCNSDGTNYTYCNCVYEHMDKALTNDEFLARSDKWEKGSNIAQDPVFTKSVTACLENIQT